MSKRQVQKMLRLMAGGGPVELTSPMASVKKLATLAFTAQQFGYEYVDVRQSGGRNNALVMMIAPDPSPQARARAAQNWAQYPDAHDGVSVPPLVPDAFELLKARINFDLTGKHAEKRMGYAAIGLTVGAGILGVRLGADAGAWVAAFLTWAFFMAIVGIGFAVNRKRNVKFAARLQAAGFMPITDEGGRVRYLPPGAQMPGQYAGQAPGQMHGQGNPFAAGPYGRQAPGAYPGQPAAQAPGAYPPQPAAPGQYGNQPAPGPYATPQQPQPQPPYGQPQPPYGQPQQPYGQPQPYPRQAPQQQTPQPPYPQPPYPQQNPHWQPPQR
ncbi:hypothetical protein [Streptomyces sp. NPDC059010]|uniref:hypothetical protein n=1 Tax=Streptomyces sp. NPDC059010 TaxID=3346695 RepID=UPI00369DF0B8